jgi:Tol biopolymer transport system component
VLSVVAGYALLTRAMSAGPGAGLVSTSPDGTGAVTMNIPGRILFDSNRGGSFGIFSMNADGSDTRVVVDGERAEIYPDPSPDGRWIAFARALSPHRLAPSEVWVCRPDGSEARRVAENGTFPTFSSDGRTLYFERERKRVMAIGLGGGREREVFPCGHKDFVGHRVVKPRVSPDGTRVAFISSRGGGWNTWIADLETGRAFHVGEGCEPVWFPDGRRLVWVKAKGVRQGSGLYVRDLENDTVEDVQDDGPPLGHEYFPSISGDGRFLLWAACPEGQHAHATSNYQIFVRDLVSGRVARLTTDTANNRWPKILPGGNDFR